MLYLCIDTSDGAGATLAHLAGEAGREATVEVVGDAASSDARAHSENLAGLIEEALAGHRPGEIDALVAGRGPAPYTGLRAGITTARTLAHTLGKPLYGVCVLDAIALDALERLEVPGPVLATSDARRRELYWGLYGPGQPWDPRACGPARVGPQTELHRTHLRDYGIDPGVCGGGIADGEEADWAARPLTVAGTGPQIYPELLAAHPAVEARVTPLGLARIAHARRARGIELPTDPLYLRKPDAVVPTGRRRVT